MTLRSRQDRTEPTAALRPRSRAALDEELIQSRQKIPLPPSQRPLLIVVVDTEEEFDWNGEFSRAATAVTAMREIHRFQTVCDEFGIRPTYVLTYPVASQEDELVPLKEFHLKERAEIGSHLHPWVNPPFTEVVNVFNSYPGNLPYQVEYEKLEELTGVIAQTFGMRPKIYKAGRYGIGPNTAAILLRQGYEIDLSPAPPMDYSFEGGPDFSSSPVVPYWLGAAGHLLCIPSTGAYVGLVKRGAHSLYKLSQRGILGQSRAPGVLARAGLIDRLRLSPEGYSLAENMKLTKALLRAGVKVFQFTLHSPSVMPNGTPYARSEQDVNKILDICRRYFEWFLIDMNGMAITASDFKRYVTSL